MADNGARNKKTGCTGGLDHQLPSTAGSEPLPLIGNDPVNGFYDECPKELNSTTASLALMEPESKKRRTLDLESFPRSDRPTAALDALIFYIDPEEVDDYDSDDLPNPILSDASEDEFSMGASTFEEKKRLFYSLNDSESDVICNPEKGTTAFAFIYKGGVMVVVDHSSIESEFAENVIDLGTHILATISGDIRDTRTFLKDLQEQYRTYANGRAVPVAEASKWVANYLSSLGEKGSSVKILVAGCDDAVPDLYYVDVMDGPVKGTEFEIGSGSFYAECALFKKNCHDMSVDEAKKLAEEGMQMITSELATDIKNSEGGEIGGFMSVYRVQSDGWKMVFRDKDQGEEEEQQH